MGKGRKGFERVGNESEGQPDLVFHMMLVWTHVDVHFFPLAELKKHLGFLYTK